MRGLTLLRCLPIEPSNTRDALAAVAVSSAAMAQVTVSGKLGFSYFDNKSAAGAKTSGFSSADGDLRVTATEDLGGGLRASAFAEFTNRGRQANTGVGRDAAVSLSGGFGTIRGGILEAANGIMGLGNGGAPVIGFDNGTMLDAPTNVDILTYTLPSMVTGLSISISTMDLTGANRETGNINQLAVSYAAGPLSVAADHADFKKFNDVTARNATCSDGAAISFAASCGSSLTTVVAARSASSAVDNRTRISASYNFGVVRIGAGHQTKSYVTAGVRDNVQTTMGISAPLGKAITVGVVRSTNKTDGAATKFTGTEYGVNYAMSKRTSLLVAAQSFKETGKASAKSTEVRLMHAF